MQLPTSAELPAWLFLPVLLPAADAAASLCGGTEPAGPASVATSAPAPSSKRTWRGGSLPSLIAAAGTTPDGAGAAARAAHIVDAVRLLLRHGRICEALSLCTALLPPAPEAERARLTAAGQAQAQFIASFAPAHAAALASQAKQAESEALSAAWSSPAAQTLPWLPFTIIELVMRVCASAMEAGHPAALPLSLPAAGAGAGMAADGEAGAADAADASPLGRLREELLARLQFHIAERVPRAEVFARSQQAARGAQEQAAAAAAGVARIEAQRAAETAAALAAAVALPKASSGAGAGPGAREALDEDEDDDGGDFTAVPSFGRRFG